MMSDEALLDRSAGIAVSTWSDALDDLGIEGVMQGIALRSGSGLVCGFAATAKHEAGPLGFFEKADFAVGLLVEAARPGRMLVVDMGGAPISTMGGLAAFAIARNGAAGVVIDGACRDLGEIRETDLWVASRHVAPTTGKGRLRLLPLGCEVVVGGIAVSEGDLIAGDETGIAVVPRARLDEALAAAERIGRVDVAVEERIRSGESFGRAAAAAGYIPAKSAR